MAKISAIIIGSINVDREIFDKLNGVKIFQVTDRKSCDEIVSNVAEDDVVFIISDGREVYYAEKFFSRLPVLKIYLVTEAHAADNKNLRDVIIQLPAEDFTKISHDIIEAFCEFEFIDLKTLLKNSGKAVAMASISDSLENAVYEIISKIESDIKSARVILVSIFGASDSLSMFKVSDATEKIQETANADAELIWKVTSTNDFGDKVKVGITVGRFIS